MEVMQAFEELERAARKLERELGILDVHNQDKAAWFAMLRGLVKSRSISIIEERLSR